MTTVALHHDIQGPPQAPALFLGHSLGTTSALWDPQVDALAAEFRVVRFDLRGHGASPVPPGPYTMTELAGDVVALADVLGVERFGYVGLSIGGAVGLTLALEHPRRVGSMVLCGTAPRFGDPATWHERAEKVAAEGTGPLLEPTEQRWFTRELRTARPKMVAAVMDMLTTTPREGYAGCCEANAGYDVTERLPEVRTPTRVIAGTEDVTAGPETAHALTDGLPRADLILVEDAAHIVNLAAPDLFNEAVREHLQRTLRA
ncbi:MAG TPA: 3-oxoadipate enol-lactonase [Nocardioidaceae bacterium]